MSTTPWRTQLIVPPAQPYSQLRGLVVMARNPAQWWSADMYDQGVRSVRLLGRTFVHVARPELARVVLLDDNDAFGRSFVTQQILVPAMGGGLLTSDSEQWRYQRRLIAPVFHAKALESFIPAMDRHSLACRDALFELDGCSAALLPYTSRAALDIIVDTLFGGVELDHVAVTRDIDDYLTRLGRPDPFALLGLPDALPRPGRRRGLAVVTSLRARCHEVIALLRAAGATDAHGLAGLLLAATADAVASLELHRRTVQEAMRLYPPVAAIVRTVVRAVRVGPFELEPGDHVTVATMPMQRNPAFWPDPHAFDESRFAPEATAARDRFTYLPFGDGPRVCIGAKFALTEAVLVLARLTPTLQFAPSEGKPPKPMLSVTLRPSDRMRLKVNRKKSRDRRK